MLYESSLNQFKDEIKGLKMIIKEQEKEREQYNLSTGLHKRILDLEKSY